MPAPVSIQRDSSAITVADSLSITIIQSSVLLSTEDRGHMAIGTGRRGQKWRTYVPVWKRITYNFDLIIIITDVKTFDTLLAK